MTLPGYAVVHRDSLTMSPLMIDGSGPYKVDDNGIGDAVVQWVADVVSSPWVEGDTVTNEIRGMVSEQWRIQVRDTTQSAVATDIAALLAAFNQKGTYQVDLVIGDETYSWKCRRSEYGLSFNRRMIFSKIATVPVTFLRYPTPLAGPV